MVEQTVEYYSAMKINELLIRTTTCVNLQVIMLNEKKLVPKVYMLSDSIYVTFLKLQNDRDGAQISGWQGLSCQRGDGHGGNRPGYKRRV